MSRLAWIGLGRLGMPLVSRLVDAGHDVAACDLDQEAVKKAGSFGARGVRSAAEAAAGAEAIFLSLPGVGAIEQVVFGKDGIASAAPSGAIIVDHSTTAPDTSIGFSDRARQLNNLRWVDAPVSGGPAAAAAGKLVAWLGGEDDDLRRVQGWLSAYVVKCLCMGGVGAGQKAKSCNQMIVASTVASWAQMLRYARSLGFAPHDLIAALEGGAADSPVSRAFATDLAADHVPEQSVRNMMKDLEIVLTQARAMAIDVPMAETALAEFVRLSVSRQP